MTHGEKKIAKIIEELTMYFFTMGSDRIQSGIERNGNKVKITVRFRGRELNYAKAGENLLNKFAEELSEVATLEKKPLLEGKNMFIILAPNNK